MMSETIKKHRGVVVPMVTPVTPEGQLDAPAVGRVVDFLLASRVDGIFVLGTTGEGSGIPWAQRRQLVDMVAAQARGRTVVYAGIGDAHPRECEVGNEFLAAGVEALVCRPPANMPLENLESWYRRILDGLNGPLLMYNMPATSKVSIPLDVVGRLLGHPKLAGIKDSENNPRRIEELLKRFGGRPGFSVFIGVGALMEMGCKLGADGIVPSVGNLVPETCIQFDHAVRETRWEEVSACFSKMNAVAALYQKGRNLNESLAALKAAMFHRGLCSPHVMPPLVKVREAEMEQIRQQMGALHLLNGR